MQDVAAPVETRDLIYSSVEVDGLPVRVLQVGSGPTLVLLHGWGANIESFSALIPDLARSHAVLALDFPGFGQSPAPAHAWGVDDYVDLTRKIFRRLGVRRPDVIGHSFGGRVLIKLASGHPDEVGRVVLVGTPGIQGRRTLRYYFRVLIARTAKQVSSMLPILRPVTQAIRRSVASPDYLNAGPLRETFVKVVGEDLAPFLSSVRAPALLVWGTKDEEVPLSVGRAMAAMIPHATLCELSGAGHFCFIDQPAYFRMTIERFLRVQES